MQLQDRHRGDPHKIVPAQSQRVEVIFQTSRRQDDVSMETINSIQVIDEKDQPCYEKVTREEFKDQLEPWKRESHVTGPLGNHSMH